MTQRWTARDIGDQQGRVAVVTGGSGGLGLATAKALAEHGATVVLAGRDQGRTQEAAARIRAELTGAPVQTAELDLASLESVRKAAADLTGRFSQLDLLINNAGLMMPPYGLTKDGFELQFGTNHLGHFALTGLLLPVLLATPGSRVVTVASSAHRAGRMDFDDLQSARHYQKTAAYGRSKLANLMFTYELQRRLSAADAGTIAVAAHPGTARTDLTRNMSALSNAALSERYRPLNAWLVQGAEEGALPILRAAADPEVIGGTYYGPAGFMQFTGSPVVVTSSGRSYNKEAQRRLWAVSEEMTQISCPV
jgi:NAD(P)-dependent dehydrogenase (short-subunit alcohol dehydrogenase family)